LLLIVQTLKKLAELFKHIAMWVLSALYTVCRWEDAQKSMYSTFAKLRRFVWKKDGDLLQDSILAYSEMPGGLNKEDLDILKSKSMTQDQYEAIRKQI
jgi:hypothetical protein